VRSGADDNYPPSKASDARGRFRHNGKIVGNGKVLGDLCLEDFSLTTPEAPFNIRRSSEVSYRHCCLPWQPFRRQNRYHENEAIHIMTAGERPENVECHIEDPRLFERKRHP
jgi:hypothetical protein